VFFLAALGSWLSFAPVDKSNTTELTATIKSINPIISYTIRTGEFSAGFSVTFQTIVVDMDALNDLSAGQTIVFRIRNKDVDSLDSDNTTIDFVSLFANKKEIITLEGF